MKGNKESHLFYQLPEGAKNVVMTGAYWIGRFLYYAFFRNQSEGREIPDWVGDHISDMTPEERTAASQGVEDALEHDST